MIQGLIRNYQRGQKRREPNRKVAEAAEDGWEYPSCPWDDDWSEGEGEESVYRLDDARNAYGRKRPVRKKFLRGTVGEDVLKKVPRCRDCGGRHTLSRCPNTYASEDPTYNRADAERNQQFCQFADHRMQGLVCGD